MDCFGQVVATDPGFAPAYTGLADSLSTLGIWGFVPADSVFPKAAALADTALKLDAGLAEAHASRALVRMFWDWAWPACEAGLQRALELNPGCALIRTWNGHYLSIVGRMREAVEEMQRAQALDPMSPICSANVGWTLYLAHENDRAIDELQRVLARAPGNAMALMYLGYADIEARRYADAIECLARANQVTGGMPFCAEGIALAHAMAGRPDHARAVLADVEARAKTSFVLDSTLAVIHLALGNDAAMFDRLDRAAKARDVLLPWMKFMPVFDRFHGHPRFQALLKTVGLA
jgi:eukaryotic-like serine/threonine-protein kinase